MIGGSIYTLEGLPGLGKTTMAVALAATTAAHLISENNPLPRDLGAFRALQSIEAARWYLQVESRRSTYSLGCRDHGVIVRDKGALSTLAYVYASDRLNARAPEFPRAVVDYKELCPELNDTIIILQGDVAASLRRREHKWDREVDGLFYSPEFLAHMHNFYEHRAESVLGRAIVRVALSGSLDRDVETLALRMSIPPATQNLIRPELVPIPCRRYSMPHREYLGSRVGPPFRQDGYTAYAFERHLLYCSPDGSVSLQAERW